MKYQAQEKPVTTKHDILGDISFPVEVPQVESLTEAVTMCGSEANLVAFFNGQLATNGKNAARAYARTYDVPKDTPTEQYPTLTAALTSKAQSCAKDYSPSSDAERGPTKTKKAAAFDAVAAYVNSGEELTKEQLIALLQQAAG